VVPSAREQQPAAAAHQRSVDRLLLIVLPTICNHIGETAAIPTIKVTQPHTGSVLISMGQLKKLDLKKWRVLASKEKANEIRLAHPFF